MHVRPVLRKVNVLTIYNIHLSIQEQPIVLPSDFISNQRSTTHSPQSIPDMLDCPIEIVIKALRAEHPGQQSDSPML